ncbi:MAG: ribosome maturation factor RimP [Candidatus Accumulibacter sp.]|jgi:ribosome maturation factor RimP|nr:ribosome maturation factor RimP [Accumulibacter sp.]
MNLNELLDKTLAGLGFDLVDVEQSPRGRVLRVFIDKPGKLGGVDVEDCALVSEHLSRVLTVENVDYERLEISSPGLDRVLRKASDFERFTGAEIALRLRLPLGGRRKFTGVLLGLSDGKIRLRVGAGDAEQKTESGAESEMEFDQDNVDKARLVPTFGNPGDKRGLKR